MITREKTSPSQDRRKPDDRRESAGRRKADHYALAGDQLADVDVPQQRRRKTVRRHEGDRRHSI